MESPKFDDIDKSWNDGKASNFFVEFGERRARFYSCPASQFASMRAPPPSYAESVVAQQKPIQQNNFCCSSASSSSCSSIASQHASPPLREHHPLPLPHLPLHPLHVIVEGKAVDDASQPPQSLQSSITLPSTTSASSTIALRQDASTQTPKRPRRRSANGMHPVEKQSIKRQNPWGGPSYSDSIARALASSADGRMKLGDIYQWFTDNMSYFTKHSGQEESLGWKNSIRHNLSLHNRFVRVQSGVDERSGSWWMINPDAKARSRRYSSTPTPILRKNSKMDQSMTEATLHVKEHIDGSHLGDIMIEADDLQEISFVNGRSHEADQFDTNTYKSPEATLRIEQNLAYLLQPSQSQQKQNAFAEPIDNNNVDDFPFCWMDDQIAHHSHPPHPPHPPHRLQTGCAMMEWTQTMEAGANFWHGPADLMLCADDVNAFAGTTGNNGFAQHLQEEKQQMLIFDQQKQYVF